MQPKDLFQFVHGGMRGYQRIYPGALQKVNPDPGMENPLIPLIKSEFETRIIRESVPRIKKCMSLAGEDRLAWRPNPATNSIGNLVLHLCGNMTQYIYSTLGAHEDRRDRSSEFSATGPFSLLELNSILDESASRSWSVIQHITEMQLLNKYTVQCFDLSGYEIVSHVIEHFSYHTGQVALLAKIMEGKDLGFYQDMKLD